jgi:hypothetical protein
MPMTSGRIAPFGAVVALVLAAACSSSSGGGSGGQPDSGGAEAGQDASEDTTGGGDTGGGDTGSQQDASEGGSTMDSPVEATGGDGGPCDPSTLGSSLVLWLEGDMGLTSSGNPAMVTWTDQSPAKNDASSGTGQTNAPTIDSTVVNMHTAVKFDGANSLVVQDATSLHWGTNSFAVWLVMSDATGTADAAAGTGFTILSKLAPMAGSSVGLALQLYPGGIEAYDYQSAQVRAPSTAVADGKFHIVGAVRSGGVLTMRLDGASAMTGPFATNVTAGGQVVALGTSPNLGPPAFAGDIAEVIAVNGPVADPACLESYLKAKYGL